MRKCKLFLLVLFVSVNFNLVGQSLNLSKNLEIKDRINLTKNTIKEQYRQKQLNNQLYQLMKDYSQINFNEFLIELENQKELKSQFYPFIEDNSKIDFESILNELERQKMLTDQLPLLMKDNNKIDLQKDTVPTESLITMDGLGDLTISSAVVVPNVNIIASITTNEVIERGLYAAASFYGLQKISENSIKDNSVNMLIKEPSYWGFGIEGATYLVHANDKVKWFKLGVNFNIDYTSRKISTVLKDTLPSKYIEPSSYILKIGAEAILGNFASIYLNYNANEILSGIDDFKEYFGTTKTKFEYLDAGIRCVLMTKNTGTKNNSSKVFIDLSFLFVNDNIEKFTTINDKVIPMLKINFNHPILSR